MKLYHVKGFFDFNKESNSPEEIREKLIKVIRHEGLSELNFEIEIDRVDKESLSEALEPKSIPIKTQVSVNPLSIPETRVETKHRRSNNGPKRKRVRRKSKSY